MKSWLAIVILLAPPSALGESPHLNPAPRGEGGGKRPTSEEAPVKIVCDDMVVQNRQQTARCKGHVHATRMLMTVTSDQGLAHYDKDGHIIDLISTGNVRMTEQSLDAAQVGAVLEQIGGEAVAEGVGRNVFGDAGSLGVALDEPLDTTDGETSVHATLGRVL